MIGSTLAANCAACALRAARMRFTAGARIQRALAAARAGLVRSEIASRSCSVTERPLPLHGRQSLAGAH